MNQRYRIPQRFPPRLSQIPHGPENSLQRFPSKRRRKDAKLLVQVSDGDWRSAAVESDAVTASRAYADGGAVCLSLVLHLSSFW